MGEHTKNGPGGLSGITIEQFFSAIPTAVLVLNRDGTAREINPPALKIFGSNAIGRNLADLVDAGQREAIEEAIRLTWEQGEGHLDEIVFQGTGGESRFIRFFFTRMNPDEQGGELILAAAISADSRRKVRDDLLMLQSEIKEHRRRQSALLSQLGHELKAPVKSLRQIAELLRDAIRESTKPEAASYVNTILRSAMEIWRIAEDFQNFAALDQTQAKPEKVIFSLPGLLEDLREHYAPVAREKGLEFYLRNHLGRPGMFRGDPRRIKQVINALLNNALQFTREGQIDLIAREEVLSPYLSDITFEVRDTGTGIDPKIQRDLWNDDPSSRSSIGVGLPIARRIAASINGQLYFETASNMGTSFFLTLPLAPSADAGFAQPQLEAPVLRKLRILLGEPPRFNSDGLISELGRDGHIVISTANREDLRGSLEFSSFDALIIDIDDQDFGGGEIIRSIRQGDWGPSCREIPIIAVTADTGLQGPEQPLPVPFDELMERPADRDTLLYLISSIIS
jgi:PAS domain S-box-containing protein